MDYVMSVGWTPDLQTRVRKEEQNACAMREFFVSLFVPDDERYILQVLENGRAFAVPGKT